MSKEDYKFPDYDHKIDLPVLVLAITQRPDFFQTFNFKPTRQWLKIQHQTAGYACHQVYMDATILKPREPEKLHIINREYSDSCINMWGLTIDCIVAYRQKIIDLFGVDCNETFQYLEEGIYPIDATQENLKKLCKDRLPKDLNNLVDWKDNSFGKFCGIMGRWQVYILGDNCD